MLEDVEQGTINAYDQIAQIWSKTHNNPNYWQKEIEKLILYVPSGKIIELGCGNGRDAKELIARGYQYLGIDASVEMLQLAIQNNHHSPFLTMNIYDIDVLATVKFDAFWASTSLLHIEKKRIDEVLQKIKNLLKPGGVGFISLKPGAGEEIVEKEYEGFSVFRYFAYYQLSEFAEILSKNDFTVLEKYRKEKYICFFCQNK